MTTETDLLDKLRKIEALFAGATTAGEKAAAGAAAERIREAIHGETDDPDEVADQPRIGR